MEVKISRMRKSLAISELSIFDVLFPDIEKPLLGVAKLVFWMGVSSFRKLPFCVEVNLFLGARFREGKFLVKRGARTKRLG